MTSQHIVSLFVTDDNCRQALTNELASVGFQVMIVRSSDELYRLVNHQRVDALVIEQDFSGFITGLDIIEQLRKQLLRPAIVLLGNFTAAERSRAAALRVDHLMARGAEIGDICEAVRTSLVYAANQGIRLPAAVRQLVQDDNVIRPLPQLVVRLADYLHDDGASTAALAKDISADARITADLLRLINSSAFGLRHHIVKVSDAVSALGIRRTASLIIAASLQDVQSHLGRSLPDNFIRWHRTRSLITASCAAAFARVCHGISRDHAYALGLLQDIGILVMAHQLGSRYLHLVDRVRSVALLQLDACERHEYSFSHAEVGAALMQKWELPTSMSSLVLDHHEEVSGIEHSQVSRSFLQVMRIGEGVVNMNDVPSPQRNRHLQQLLQSGGHLDQACIRTCLAEAISTAAEMARIFQIPVPQGEDWQRLIAQVHEEVRRSTTTTKPLSSSTPSASAPAARIHGVQPAFLDELH